MMNLLNIYRFGGYLCILGVDVRTSIRVLVVLVKYGHICYYRYDLAAKFWTNCNFSTFFAAVLDQTTEQ